jgi:hypothetical protein
VGKQLADNTQTHTDIKKGFVMGILLVDSMKAARFEPGFRTEISDHGDLPELRDQRCQTLGNRSAEWYRPCGHVGAMAVG